MKKNLQIFLAFLIGFMPFLSAQETSIPQPNTPQTFKTLTGDYIKHQDQLALKNTEDWWQPDTVVLIGSYMRVLYSYNSSGYNTLSTYQYFLPSTNEWINYYRYVYEYKQNNKLSKQFYQNFEDNEWKSSRRINYKYDGNWNLLEEFSEYTYLEVWFSSYLNTYVYENNRLISELEQKYKTNTTLINVNKKEYLYSNDKITTYISYEWDEIHSLWTKIEKHTYTYETENLINMVTQKGSDENEWVNSDKYDYFYNGFGNCVTIINKHWDVNNNLWIDYIEVFSEYKNNSLIEKRLYKLFFEGIWRNSTQELYTYTSHDKLATHTSQFWLNNEWMVVLTNEYLYDESDNLVEHTTNSDYSYPQKFRYEYNNNNGIRGEYYEYISNQWISRISLIEMHYNNMQSTYKNSIDCNSITLSYVKTSKPSGIETQPQSTITIYPNPTKDYINISVENDKIENVEIYNLTGKLVKQEKSNKINISNLPVGMYIIKVETDGGNCIKKVIKD
jgi:hypothetical protein